MLYWKFPWPITMVRAPMFLVILWYTPCTLIHRHFEKWNESALKVLSDWTKILMLPHELQIKSSLIIIIRPSWYLQVMERGTKGNQPWVPTMTSDSCLSSRLIPMTEYVIRLSSIIFPTCVRLATINHVRLSYIWYISYSNYLKDLMKIFCEFFSI